MWRIGASPCAWQCQIGEQSSSQRSSQGRPTGDSSVKLGLSERVVDHSRTVSPGSSEISASPPSTDTPAVVTASPGKSGTRSSTAAPPGLSRLRR